MLNLPSIHLDTLSFIIGFVAGSMFWYVLGLLRPMLPVWQRRFKAYIESVNYRNKVGAEEHLRQEIILRAQRNHLAAPMFSLDEVIIAPRLVAPPPYHDPGTTARNNPIAAETIPYLPDWPELTSTLGVPLLTPIEAVEHGSNITIIGQPGSGKTVTLAYLASQLARRDHACEALKDALPLYMHAIDLNTGLNTGGNGDRDPASALVKTVTAQVSLVYQPQVSRFLQGLVKAKTRKLVLLLDGVDELESDEVSSFAAFLFDLMQNQPQMQVVMTGSDTYLDGLVHMGFYPLTVACWNASQVAEFKQRWADLWAQWMTPEAKKQVPTADVVDPLLITSWLYGERNYETPLEWTLKTWAAYAGDMYGASLLQLIETHLSRFMPSPELLPALDDLACQMVKRGKVWMDIDDMAAILTRYAPTGGKVETPLPAESTESAEAVPEVVKTKKKKGKGTEIIVTQGERIISALQSGGILIQHAGRRLRFSNPVFLGYLGGIAASENDVPGILEKIDWVVNAQVLRFMAACTPEASWMTAVLQENEPPVFRNWLFAARWLPDASSSSDLRTYLLSNFVRMIQDNNLCLAIRAKLAAAFVISRDPSAQKLFKTLLQSRSADLRQIGAMGCGAIGNSQSITDLLNLLADPSGAVRNTACLAIGALPGETALNTLVDILMQGDEELRQAAAESLALRSDKGRKVLEEAIASPDLLARRAAVFGVSVLHDSWAQQLLEKVAVEDGQWVVRNAAAEELEDQHKPACPALLPMPVPAESPWLLAFAGKLGLGIRPGEPAVDILINALKSGDDEEQVAALNLLKKEPVEGVVGVLYNVLYGSQTQLHDAALLALWYISISGFKMPPPIKYGLG